MSSDVTNALRRCADEKDKSAYRELFQLTYEELHKRAKKLHFARRNRTIQPTAVVHEAYIKLSNAGLAGVRDSKHFYSLAAETMRDILVDNYRRKQALKRGGGRPKAEGFDLDQIATDQTNWTAVDLSLERLKRENARQYEIVMLHFFSGLEFTKIADWLEKNPKTIGRDWKAAKAFLAKSIDDLAD